MIVRRCEPGDLPDVIGLARQFHSESPSHSFLPFDPLTVHILISNAIDNDSWLPLVAYASGGELVGMGLFFALPTFFGPAIEGGDLAFYVRPDRRGSIAAAGIMRRLVGWIAEKGIARMRLGIDTGIDDARAERFFEGSGFVRSGSVWTLRPAIGEPLDE